MHTQAKIQVQDDVQGFIAAVDAELEASRGLGNVRVQFTSGSFELVNDARQAMRDLAEKIGVFGAEIQHWERNGDCGATWNVGRAAAKTL